MENLKIIFAKSKDIEKIQDKLLYDTELREKLNIRDNGQTFVRNDTWNATFVAKVGSNIMGMIKVSFYASESSACIDGIFVLESYRHLGIATKLLTFAENYSKDIWPTNVFHALTIQNPPMETLFKKMGYKKMGTYKKCVYRNNKYLSQTMWRKNV